MQTCGVIVYFKEVQLVMNVGRRSFLALLEVERRQVSHTLGTNLSSTAYFPYELGPVT
jgi:hypothetical protein